MGLFRHRAGRKREKAAPGLLEEQTRTAVAQPEAARREVTAEARPNPDQPGWGRTLGQQGLLEEQTRTVAAQPEAARRKVTAEARPNPDQPGWGRTLGQQIGKAREDRGSQS